ncbi:MAG: hypothetical protein HOP13_01895 [Alphaproteobacteria bacterium]|nr:hypothetical protein [Alphaproteobacteria bacterium]
MSGEVRVTASRARLALALAVLVDAIQLPLQGASLTGIGTLPAEAIDLAIDAATALIISRLIGFHWALLPTLAIELIPFIDLAPTWFACVTYVISRRKKEGRYVEGNG